MTTTTVPPSIIAKKQDPTPTGPTSNNSTVTTTTTTTTEPPKPKRIRNPPHIIAANTWAELSTDKYFKDTHLNKRNVAMLKLEKEKLDKKVKKLREVYKLEDKEIFTHTNPNLVEKIRKFKMHLIELKIGNNSAVGKDNNKDKESKSKSITDIITGIQRCFIEIKLLIKDLHKSQIKKSEEKQEELKKRQEEHVKNRSSPVENACAPVENPNLNLSQTDAERKRLNPFYLTKQEREDIQKQLNVIADEMEEKGKLLTQYEAIFGVGLSVSTMNKLFDRSKQPKPLKIQFFFKFLLKFYFIVSYGSISNLY